MSLSSFCIKYKLPLCLVVFILLGFILVQVSASIKEGYAVNGVNLTPVISCIDPSIKNNCAKCTSSYFGVAGSEKRCAWHKDSSNNMYSCLTSDNTTPVGEFSCPKDTSTKPGCTACPKLKLLDTPTWILDQ